MLDFGTGLATQVTSSADYYELPAWMPDGRSLLHVALRGGQPRTVLVRIDGTVTPREVAIDAAIGGVRVSPDGRQLLFTKRGSGGDTDVWVAPIDAPDQARAISGSPSNEIALTFSPDGRWVTFLTDRSGANGVAVARLFNEVSGMRLGEPIPLTAGGASATVWTRDGREIIVEAAGERLLAVGLTIQGDTLTPSLPEPLFTLPPTFSGFGNGWTVTPDGARFLVADTPGAMGQTFRVLTNWRSRLR
jgi:Tol biopolymer transport system component